MKKTLYLFLAAALSMLSVSGCKESDSKPSTPAMEPEVTLVALESGFTTFSFKVTVKDADDAAYLFLEADQAAPSAETVLADGEHIDAVAAADGITVELTGLESAVAYKLYVAASNGETVMSEPEVLPFTTESEYFADVESTATLAWYYGLDETVGGDLVFLSLCNAELDKYSAMPSGEGELLRLYMYTEKTDKDNMALAPGTYTLVTEPSAPFEVAGGDYSAFALSTEDGWMQIGYESGTVTVERDGDTYDIVAEMVIADGLGTKVRGKFSGVLDFEDLTDGYIHFDSDMNEVMLGHSGGIYSGDENCNDYTMTFYNCELDSDGFIVGAGFLFNTELFFDVNGTDYSGTYKPATDWMNGYKNYTYMPGDVMYYYGFYMPYGTYLSEYDDYGNLIRIGLVVDGDIDVSISDGVLSMNGVLTTDKGHEITVSYEGPEDLTDMTQMSVSSASVKIRPAAKPGKSADAGVTGWRAL